MTEIKRLRVEADLTQAEVCARTGIARPNLSAYESGRREPSAETLERVRTACRKRPSELWPAMRSEIAEIARQHKGKAVSVFGSAARGDDTWQSDLDLLVTLDDDAGMLDLVRMAARLERLLGVPVDLVDRDALDVDGDAFDRDVLREAVAIS